MPLTVDTKSALHFPSPQFLTLGNFKRGVITLTSPSKLPKNALAAGDNCLLVEDGQPSIRPGMQWYGTAPLLPTPSSVGTLGLLTGTQLGIGVYQYVITYQNAQGETLASTAVSITTTAGNQGVQLGTTNDIPGGPGGTLYRNIYRTKVGGSTFYLVYQLGKVGGTPVRFYNDTTPDASLPTTQPPLINTATTGAISGFNYFDTGSATHLVCCADGNIFRSTDNATTWTLCTGITLRVGLQVNMVQYNSYLYIVNGVDIIARYDPVHNGTVLQTYTVLTTPAAPTATPTGLTGSSYTVYYEISAVSQVGFSMASTQVTQTVGKPRENFDTTSNYVTLTLPSPQATQARTDIYYSIDNLHFYYLDSVVASQTTYKDDGTAIIVPSTIAPTTNTTQGPTVAELVTVGNRLYGVRDPNFPYRIWFTSGSSPLGSFSDGYDGGYLDWQLGGKYFPTQVADYRDGKGTSIATVWLNSADSQGAIIQMSLSTLTVGNLSITVPSAYKLPGSRGTPAPRSVINVLNDYHFYNSQAFYTLGNKPNLLQILSTDEVSANIRPTVRTINPAAESSIASIYYDAKVYISYPIGTSTINNYTAIYDTELQSWMPKSYDKGFSQFLRYTDTAGIHHLLAVKPGDNQLTELGTLYTPSASILGDYGIPFQTNLLTGLYSVQKDRFGFQFTEEMEYEFSNPTGVITVELLGIDHAKGFTSVKTAVLNEVTVTNNTTGWDTEVWDTDNWDDTSIVPVIISETSAKRYTVVNRELNAVQWHIYTNSLQSAYILRTLQTWGTDTNDAHPSKWRITAS